MTTNLLQRVRSNPAHRRLLASVRRAIPDETVATHVLAGVSGGSDSIALLLLLKAACSSARVRVTAAYVDHGLRPAAAMETAIVEGLCRRLGAQFLATEIPSLRHPSESHLREARYAALERLATQCGATCIATGHTRDDQIETILFRFLRGSSRGGLAGIRTVHEDLIRPLLGLGREELRACLRNVGVGWIEDPTNATLRYTRNKIRHVLIPAVERSMGRGRLDHLPEVADVWRAEDAYLEEEASRFGAYVMRGTGAELHIDLVAFAAVPPALRPRILRTWLRSFGVDEVPLRHLRSVMGLIAEDEGSSTLALEGLTVMRAYSRLCVRPDVARRLAAEHELRLDSPGAYRGPKGEWTITVDPRPRGEPPLAASVRRQVVEFSAEQLSAPLRLRPRRRGDAIHTHLHGRRKVHDIMIEARVPRTERETWPVLTSADALIWVPGLAVAAEMESALKGKGGPRVRLAWRRSSQ